MARALQPILAHGEMLLPLLYLVTRMPIVGFGLFMAGILRERSKRPSGFTLALRLILAGIVSYFIGLLVIPIDPYAEKWMWGFVAIYLVLGGYIAFLAEDLRRKMMVVAREKVSAFPFLYLKRKAEGQRARCNH